MINVKDFGAIGDGKADDTAALQKTFDSLDKPINRYKWSESGDRVYFPFGHYRTYKPLDIRCSNVTIVGDSGNDYTGRNCWIEYMRKTGPAIRLAKGAHSVNGFSIKGVTLVGRDRPGVHGIEISTGQKFRSDINIQNGIFCFDIGVIVTKEKQTQIGFLTLDRSSIRLNKQALVFSRLTSVNGFSCVNAQLSQNYKSKTNNPVIDARIFGGRIEGCRLEGQNHAVRIHNSTDVRFIGNWFEGNKYGALTVEKSNRITVANNYRFKDTDYYGKFRFLKSKNIFVQDPLEGFDFKSCDNVNRAVVI